MPADAVALVIVVQEGAVKTILLCFLTLDESQFILEACKWSTNIACFWPSNFPISKCTAGHL